MIITRIQGQNFSTSNRFRKNAQKNTPNTIGTNYAQIKYAKLPLAFNYGTNINYGGNIHFGNNLSRGRTVDDIEFDNYKAMIAPERKNKRIVEFYRRRCVDFTNDLIEDSNNIVDKKFTTLPLDSDMKMDAFIETSKIYTRYKDYQIVSLGRSMKWFLNAATWMKDGIDGYKMAAFSGRWYQPSGNGNVDRRNIAAPTEEEIVAYRKYLKNKRLDPKSIVNEFEKNGRKTIITDYVCTGKGFTSFLEVMADYAADQKVLERFSKSIELVKFGSKTYFEKLFNQEYVSDPYVCMPPKLLPYEKNIKQVYYDMDYDMFREMLLNQNTNECRSTYYPHFAWAKYNPDRFRTGKAAPKELEALAEKYGSKRLFINFNELLGDFRNYLNFRILDGLNTRNMLRDALPKKIK